LLDGDGYTRSLDLKANEVTSVKFRIRAKAIGYQPLTVKAFGTKKSDAVKRSVRGRAQRPRIERVVSDRLKGNVQPHARHPGQCTGRCFQAEVRMYPGAMAQVVDGLDA